MGNDWIEHLEAGGDHSSSALSPLRHHPLFPSPSPPTSSNSTATITTSPPPRVVCARCRCDLTLLSDVVWEGVMGTRSEPAFLSRRCVNAALSAQVRRGVQLSSGAYDLADVECRRCRQVLGWKYLRRACSSGEKFKVGCTMLAAARLEKVVGFDDDGEDDDRGGSGGGGDDEQQQQQQQPPGPPRRYLFIGRET